MLRDALADHDTAHDASLASLDTLDTTRLRPGDPLVLLSVDASLTFTPEHLLLLAIVRQTFRDLFSPRTLRVRTARDWFLSKDKSWPFHFSTICEYLNVTPKHLRRYARHITVPTPRVRTRLARAQPQPQHVRSRRQQAHAA